MNTIAPPLGMAICAALQKMLQSLIDLNRNMSICTPNGPRLEPLHYGKNYKLQMHCSTATWNCVTGQAQVAADAQGTCTGPVTWAHLRITSAASLRVVQAASAVCSTDMACTPGKHGQVSLPMWSMHSVERPYLRGCAGGLPQHSAH